MKTNTEINAWEIKDNKYNLEGKARPKSWEQTERIASVSNVDLSDKEWSDLANIILSPPAMGGIIKV